MAAPGLWARVFSALLVAVAVPLIVGLASLGAGIAIPGRVFLVIAGGAFLGAIAWVSVLSVLYSRYLTDEIRDLQSFTERGGGDSSSELGRAYQQVADALGERERQVSTLAAGAREIPIDQSPVDVVRAVVDLARSVMGDPTWVGVVMSAEPPELLPPGVYAGRRDDQDTRPLDDLEQWASVSLAETDQAAARLDGPWGAFAAARMRVGERLGGILMAPWEGRAQPTPAELALMALVAQHAAGAVDHALLYARVRSQADDLNRLASVQADFLRGVTHDLQTPLTSIGAMANELRADPSLSAAGRDDLDVITHQAERLRRMVGQLLVASRLEAGVVTPKVEVFAVAPLVERTWAAMRTDRPFAIHVDGPTYLAVADEDRVEQVMWAVLDNAVKYSPAGSPIEVRVSPLAEWISISVVDAGMGLDGDAQARAFEQFYRSTPARNAVPDGSGIGLYAARGLMEAMGGSIRLESDLGRGTTVTILLPAEYAEATE